MAHKKAGSSSKNGRDSVGQRLGVKAGDGQFVPAGSIIVRQRGMTFIAGSGAGLGHDYTVFATVSGHVKFDHASKAKKRIRVLPLETAIDGATGSNGHRPAAASATKPAATKHAVTKTESAATKTESASARSAAAKSAATKTESAGGTATATATATKPKTRPTTDAAAATPKTTTPRSKTTADPEATAD